jgi:hypothetical protein
MKSKRNQNEMDALDNIFGVKPKGVIFLPAQPYQVRFNCKEGCLSLGEDDHLGKEAEISILKVSRYFGTIGMTADTEWLQIFFVGAAGCTVLPGNTVCISYLKTRSLSNFQREVTKLMAAGPIQLRESSGSHSPPIPREQINISQPHSLTGNGLVMPR